VFYALIPNHWLPVLAISRKENWSIGQTTSVTFVAGLSHALSTVLLWIIIALLGVKLPETIAHFTHLIAPTVLITLGLFSLYQHHRHRHFHLEAQTNPLSKNKVVIGLIIAMFFSPCFEIEANFLMAGAHG
jgi:nickel/cobalt exporter